MTSGEASLRDRLVWYATAAAGPITAAAANFLLSLALLVRLPVEDFGRMSFVILVSQFSIGLWGALFTSPLLVLAPRVERAGEGHDGEAAGELSGLIAASLFALWPGFAIFVAVAVIVGLTPQQGCIYGAFAALVLARQLARAWSLAHGAYRLTMLSDVVYSTFLSVGAAALFLLQSIGVTMALYMLLAAVSAGLMPFVTPFGVSGLRLPDLRRVAAYRPVWSRDARWALLGVVSTEATVNSHSYIVAAFAGLASFAPIAATALFIRPITVAINALVEFERARCARRIADSDFPAVQSARRHLRHMLLAVWVLTALVAGAAILFIPARFMVAKFGFDTVVAGAALWLGVALARLLHGPEGLILLAAGRFRQLAWISVSTAGASVLAVCILVVSFTPVFSIAGIIAGEGAFAFLVWRATSRFLGTAMPQASK